MSDPGQPTFLKTISFPGTIHLIQTDEQMSAAAEVLQAASILGFDTETRPSFRKGEVYKVALLQLATEADAFVIRLHYLTDFQMIRQILENDRILKVGLANRDDLKGLRKWFPLEPKNFVELQDMAKAKGLKNFGLKGMTEEVLNARLSKGPKLTNWESKSFTDEQIMYAATDAWIGLRLYQALIHRPDSPSSPPQGRPAL